MGSFCGYICWPDLFSKVGRWPEKVGRRAFLGVVKIGKNSFCGHICPEKVANWPDLKTKVARKKPVFPGGFGLCGQMSTFFS